MNADKIKNRMDRIHKIQTTGHPCLGRNPVNPVYFLSPIGVHRRSSATLFFCLCVAAAAAYGQSIRIPDFREPERTTLKPGEACDKCGVIRSIREVQVRRPVPVPEAFRTNPGGGLGSDVYVGAVVALPLSEKGEQPGKPFVGGVGTPEMRERFSESTYEITIRLDEGGFTQVTRSDGASYRIGDRVRVSGIELELLAP
jgi:hypothetical protein